MDKFVIRGGNPLLGTVRISGAKNAALPDMAAALLSEEPVTLENIPQVRDIETTRKLLSAMGAEVELGYGRAQHRTTICCRNLTSPDRKSTRLNSSHLVISYAVFCLKNRVASIMENTNLSTQQQVSEIMRQMLTQAQTAGQYFTNDQIKEMTRKVSAEVDLVHQQTQNQRYGSSHIGATAKDISNVVTDVFFCVVGIPHGFDQAPADTCYH